MNEEHRWVKRKGFKWVVCQRCDLVALKNTATERAIRKPCVGQYINVQVPEHLKTPVPDK